MPVDVGQYIRDQRDLAQMSLRQLASASGISNPYLSQVERGLRRPSAEILGRIADALRISTEALYVRAGLLDPAESGASTEAAIKADPTLNDRQRRALLEIYSAFQAENRASGAQPTSGTAAHEAAAATRRKAER